MSHKYKKLSTLIGLLYAMYNAHAKIANTVIFNYYIVLFKKSVKQLKYHFETKNCSALYILLD